MKNIIPDVLIRISNEIKNRGGACFIIGGAVRDFFMNSIHGFGTTPKDFDCEVFGISQPDLVSVLSAFGRVSEVGASFGVTKLSTPTDEFDFSLPRRDNLTGKGHKGFDVVVDTTMTPTDAAFRRDFTMNAISFDIVEGTFFDPFGGIEDIQNLTLKHVSHHFSEDPLRVLRGMQFCSRFNLNPSPELLVLSQSIVSEFATLPVERVREEWMKWAKGNTPSAGLKFLKDSGWLVHFPELSVLVNCPQQPEWHPEGDVWEHTLHTVDAMAFQCQRDGIVGEHRAKLMFGALCHDMGKPATTVFSDGAWRSPAHDVIGMTPTRNFMQRIFSVEGQKEDSDFTVFAVKATQLHMRHLGFEGSKSQVRRLALEFSIADLVQIVEADHNARPFSPSTWAENSEVRHMLRIADEIGVTTNAPKPLIMGRDLIMMGIKQSKEMGDILKSIFQAQLDGAFDDKPSALLFAEDFLKNIVTL
jgi:tRNA nucleotidyltransferase (CCA-adding enzyme)